MNSYKTIVARIKRLVQPGRFLAKLRIKAAKAHAHNYTVLTASSIAKEFKYRRLLANSDPVPNPKVIARVKPEVKPAVKPAVKPHKETR